MNPFQENKIYRLQYVNGATKNLSRDELENIYLNPPNPIPELNGNKTWISNYVGTFWMPLMGADSFAVYFQLMKMAYGEKDYAFPSIPYLATLTGMSQNTVRKSIKKLQDLNFVVVVQVLDAWDMKQTSNLYLLSNTIPFISTIQYNELPKRLKDEHDAFMEKIRKRTAIVEHLPIYSQKSLK